VPEGGHLHREVVTLEGEVVGVLGHRELELAARLVLQVEVDAAEVVVAAERVLVVQVDARPPRVPHRLRLGVVAAEVRHVLVLPPGHLLHLEMARLGVALLLPLKCGNLRLCAEVRVRDAVTTPAPLRLAAVLVVRADRAVALVVARHDARRVLVQALDRHRREGLHRLRQLSGVHHATVTSKPGQAKLHAACHDGHSTACPRSHM